MAGATRGWIERGVKMANSTDEDARIGFLVNAYMACDHESRRMMIAAASGIADNATRKRSAGPAAIISFNDR